MITLKEVIDTVQEDTTKRTLEPESLFVVFNYGNGVRSMLHKRSASPNVLYDDFYFNDMYHPCRHRFHEGSNSLHDLLLNMLNREDGVLVAYKTFIEALNKENGLTIATESIKK